MPGPVFLDGDRISLRVPSTEDVEFLATYENDPRVRATRSVQTPTGDDDVARFVGGTLGRNDDTHALLACVDDRPVGLVLLLREQRNDQVFRRGELAYWIAPDDQGNGYATEASELILDHAFDRLGLHKVIAKAYADNEGSIRVLEKLGFEREGVQRREAYVDGEWRDFQRFGLLEGEWRTAGSAPDD